MDNEIIYRKPKKRRRIIVLIVSVLILLFIGIGGWLILRVPKPQNVFEEMYNDRVYSDGHPLLENMSVVNVVYERYVPYGKNPDPWAWSAPDDTCVYVYYDKSKLDENERQLRENEYIYIYFYKDKRKAVVIEHGYRTGSGMYANTLWGKYTYNMETKELSYSTNYTNDKDPFLYDWVLTDWFNYNAEESAFSMENLGEFTNVR